MMIATVLLITLPLPLEVDEVKVAGLKVGANVGAGETGVGVPVVGDADGVGEVEVGGLGARVGEVEVGGLGASVGAGETGGTVIGDDVGAPPHAGVTIAARS